jgi:hypothetical protein
MLKTQVAYGPGGRVLLVGSITQIGPEDEGAWVVSASHGGVSSGEFALEVPLRGAFFNDAGVGKDAAGTAALDMLQRHGVAAATVSHLSARIGDGQDTWANGVVSHANLLALALGIRPGLALQASLRGLISG